MKKIVSISIVLSLVLIVSSLSTVAFAAPPPVARQMEIIAAQSEGSTIRTVDPAKAYDTASGAILLQVYDTLVAFDGEHLDRYLMMLATEWSVKYYDPKPVDPVTGLEWSATYYFKIRTGVPWQDPAFGSMTTEDVEYTFERGMVHSYSGSPQWMFFEPLLNGATARVINGRVYNIVGNATEAAIVGKMIDHAVESNSTHVWFNLAFPGAYAPFIQILTQTWSSILCKNWCLSLGRATEWDGVWGDYVEWATHYRPALPVLDDPQWAAMGNGPFKLSHLDRVLKYWDCDRFTGYWRGWGNAVGNYGVGWPAFGGSKPAGYIDRYVWTWAYDWPARSTKFLNGEVDLCYVPRSYKDQVENHANIRCMYPLPSISCDALFYTFDISPTTPYGTILDAGVLGETGIPRDFFGNATWGIYVRKAFSQLIDFDAYIQAAYLGEAMQPATALIPTLTYYNGSIPKYTFNKDAAITLLKKVPGLWETGFTIKICYNTGNVERQQLADQLGTVINSLNPKFHVETQSIDWATYLNAMESQQLTCFDIGWLGDYPDAHNFAYSFYATWGDFSQYQPYSNPVMDDLVTAGISSPDGPERARIYSEIAQLAIDDCPSVALDMAYGRHWEVSWLCGWYYNAIVPGTYVANLWKWYYTPHAQQDSIPANSTGNLLPYDVNYDGKTNMVDIGTTAASFGAVFGPPTSIKWVYRADFNNDRKIDMKDIGGVAKNFGKTATAWTPPV